MLVLWDEAVDQKFFSCMWCRGAEGGQDPFRTHKWIWHLSQLMEESSVLFQANFSNRSDGRKFSQQVTRLHSTAGSSISEDTEIFLHSNMSVITPPFNHNQCSPFTFHLTIQVSVPVHPKRPEDNTVSLWSLLISSPSS